MNQPNNDYIDVQAEPSAPPAHQPREIVVAAQSNFMPLLTGEEAQRRLNELKTFVRANMNKDIDYGVIPGTGNKQVLLKPGAEKLCTLFGLRSSFVVVGKVENWDEGFFHYHYKCQLWRGNICIAEGDGACNSLEKKYRWRSVYENKATDEEKERAVRREPRPSKDGGTYTVLILENDDVYSLVNTIMKMAEKRALVAATLIAVNASDYFTQDLEEEPQEKQTRVRPQRQSEQAAAAASTPKDDLAESAKESDRQEKLAQEREQGGGKAIDWSRPHVKGVVAQLYKDQKSNDKGPYTVFTGYINRVRYSTFSETAGAMLESAQRSKAPVVVFFEVKGNFNNISEVHYAADLQ